MFENVRIRPEAELDLQDAYSYVEQCKNGLGASFMDCVQSALAKISLNYQHYPIVYNSIRCVLVRRFPFAVFFKEVDDVIVMFSEGMNEIPMFLQGDK
jgi:hypothetical protein